ncbi:MAG: c-type cytochrome [Betaproteobacteria bacterium]|nr:c-type cytochrome [Betaproteobacteria bacterium]
MKPNNKVWKQMGVLVLAFATLAPAWGGEDESGPVNPYSGDKAVAKEGAELFNQYCSHCHGPWAEQGERVRDLRRLRIRYGDYATETFWTTVHKGRMEKGMPVWGGVLSDDVLWRIYTFLETVQTEE